MERKREEGEGGCPDGREVKREEEGKVATVFFFFVLGFCIELYKRENRELRA